MVKRAFAFMFLALALSSTAASSASAGEVSIVFVRFHEGTIADPDPGSMDTVWLPEDFDQQYQQLLGRVEVAGVTGLRPVGIAWRHLDARRSKGHAVPADLVDFSTVYAAQLGVLADPEQVAATLSAFEEVEYAEVPGFGVLFDRYTGDQWYMENTGQTMDNCEEQKDCTADLDANIPEAWILSDSSDALVGIMDQGVYTGGTPPFTPIHAELADVYNAALSRDFTGNGMNDTQTGDYHGTKVAGLVAGSCEAIGTFQGVAGWTSPSGWAPLVVYRVGAGGATSQEWTIDALDFICNPDSAAYGKVRVVTISWGITDENEPPSDTLSDAFSNAYEEGVAIFAAAGNAGAADFRPYPAAYIDFTQSVAHVLCDSTRLGYYTGNYIDLTAPGGADIQTVQHTSGLYDCFSGTSAATPIAAGIASLMLGYCPSLTNDDVYEVMRCTAEDIGPSGFDNFYGHGLVRADAAIEALQFAGGMVSVATAPGTSITAVDSLTMAFKNIPNRVLDTSWAVVYKVSGTASIVSEEVKCAWPRHKECGTVRGPADLYYLDSHQGGGPYFNGRRLGTWAQLEQASGTDYTAYGYTYHLYDDSSKQQDRGWYPFNPFAYIPSPLFSIAYLEEDESKEAPFVNPGNSGGRARVCFVGSQLRLDLREAERIRLRAYDVSGRLAADFGVRRMGAGRHTLDMVKELGARGVSSGVYFIRVETLEGIYTGKSVVVR